jgi:serine/threonine protein kinase
MPLGTVLHMHAQPVTRATGAADMWAVGVIAFELLTNELLFPVNASEDAIRAALLGQAPLPWEEGGEGAEERRQKLRGLRRIVMPCLDRNPGQRPTAAQVLRSWWHLFDEMKTQGTFGGAPARSEAEAKDASKPSEGEHAAASALSATSEGRIQPCVQHCDPACLLIVMQGRSCKMRQSDAWP